MVYVNKPLLQQPYEIWQCLDMVMDVQRIYYFKFNALLFHVFARSVLSKYKEI